MYARLAFAVAINVDPDILIIDEALSVGDMRFQQKCYRKFREFQEAKKTILFVTHDTSTIINYCTHTIWINDGTKIEEGRPELICKKYMSVMAYDQLSVSTSLEKNDSQVDTIRDSYRWVSTEGFDSFGEKKIIITNVLLIDETNIHKDSLVGGETVTLKMKMYSKENINDLIAGFIVHDHLGNPIFGSNTYIHNYGRLDFKAQKEYIINFTFKVPYLKNGDFTISPAIAEGTQGEHIQHHWVHNALHFKIYSLDEESKMNWIILLKKINIEVENKSE